MEDFISEIPMYLSVTRITDIVQSAMSERNSISDNLFCAYQALVREKLTAENELGILEEWLNECRKRSTE
jgi:hypothetical protein